jgi:hypothetical protein
VHAHLVAVRAEPEDRSDDEEGPEGDRQDEQEGGQPGEEARRPGWSLGMAAHPSVWLAYRFSLVSINDTSISDGRQDLRQDYVNA